MTRPLLLPLGVTVIVLLAGCQGSTDRDTNNGKTLPYSFKDGAIEGTVIDDQGTPVPGALVVVQGPGLRTKSSPTGTYILRHVPPGPQILSAQADGFAPAQLEINVEVATLTNATLIITRLADLELFVDRARIDFTLGILGGRMINQGLIEANIDTFSHQLVRKPVTVLATARWEQPPPPGPARMGLSLHMDGPPGNQSIGTSPLTARVDLAEHEEKTAFTLTFSPPPGCAFLGPCMIDEDAVFVTRDLPATIVTAAFFKEPPATDFVAEEPSG